MLRVTYLFRIDIFSTSVLIRKHKASQCRNCLRSHKSYQQSWIRRSIREWIGLKSVELFRIAWTKEDLNITTAIVRRGYDTKKKNPGWLFRKRLVSFRISYRYCSIYWRRRCKLFQIIRKTYSSALKLFRKLLLPIHNTLEPVNVAST